MLKSGGKCPTARRRIRRAGRSGNTQGFKTEDDGRTGRLPQNARPSFLVIQDVA